jgi:hypothetical protein
VDQSLLRIDATANINFHLTWEIGADGTTILKWILEE